MKAARVQDLLSFLHVLKPNDFGSVRPGEEIKAARFGHKAMDELEAAIPDLLGANDKLNASLDPLKREELVELTRISEETAESPEAEREAKRNAATEAANRKITARAKELAEELGVEAKREVDTTVHIGSDERFIFLKDVFTKFAHQRFSLLEPLVEIADALDAAGEDE